MSEAKKIYPSRRIKGVCFYKTEDLSKILGLGMLTVRRYLSTGKIKGAVKIGRRFYLSSRNLNRFLGKEK